MNREFNPRIMVVREGDSLPTASADFFLTRAVLQVAANQDDEYLCLRTAAGGYEWIATTLDFTDDIDDIEGDILSLNDDITALTLVVAGKASTVHTHAESDVTSLVADLALKAPLASPTFTGTVNAAAISSTSLFATTLTTNGDVSFGNAQTDTVTFHSHLAVTGNDVSFTNTPFGSYPGSGTTPSGTLVNGNDTAFLVTYSTGTGATAGDMFRVDFDIARPSSAYIVLCNPMNNGASQVQPYITVRQTTGFTVVAKGTPPSSTSVQFGVLVIDV